MASAIALELSQTAAWSMICRSLWQIGAACICCPVLHARYAHLHDPVQIVGVHAC